MSATVSVVIASYNRFDSLQDTIKSIQLQTYPVLEIIVVNDGSEDPRYKSLSIPGVTVLHNEVNTKQIYGFPNISQVRNKGILISKGDFIAFCDDDDVWLPEKLERQFARMKEDGTYFCATDGYFCLTPWNSTDLEDELKHHFHAKYPRYNAEYYWPRLRELYGGIDAFPRIWTYPFIARHNGIILSSALVYKRVFEVSGMFHDSNMRENPEDYDLWKRILQVIPMSYVEEPCFGWAAYPYKYG
jgi:glycosyltransferase involved in cell wall biosynthesis